MRRLKRITPARILSWEPCNPPYTDERVKELFGGRRSATIREILTARNVPPADLIWLACHGGVLDDKTLRLFAAYCAGRALRRERKAGREPDARSWKAVCVARRFAMGKATTGELRAAREAAREAAWAAGEGARAAGAAAWVTGEAAGEAAGAAARVAAREAGAAAGAAGAAARTAARVAREATWAAPRAAARAAAWAAWEAAWAAAGEAAREAREEEAKQQLAWLRRYLG